MSHMLGLIKEDVGEDEPFVRANENQVAFGHADPFGWRGGMNRIPEGR